MDLHPDQLSTAQIVVAVDEIEERLARERGLAHERVSQRRSTPPQRWWSSGLQQPVVVGDRGQRPVVTGQRPDRHDRSGAVGGRPAGLDEDHLGIDDADVDAGHEGGADGVSGQRALTEQELDESAVPA